MQFVFINKISVSNIFQKFALLKLDHVIDYQIKAFETFGKLI